MEISKMEADYPNDKWVRIFCDYCADPVWDKDGCNVTLEELPVVQQLQQMLRDWAIWFEMSSGPREDSFDVLSHSEIGERLAKAVKRALPDWTVIYLNQSKIPDNYAALDDRSAFEYEITE